MLTFLNITANNTLINITKVMPCILAKGDPIFLLKYSQISLIPTFLKIFEPVIFTQSHSLLLQILFL